LRIDEYLLSEVEKIKSFQNDNNYMLMNMSLLQRMYNIDYRYDWISKFKDEIDSFYNDLKLNLKVS